MTFATMHEFVEFLMETDGVTLQEADREGTYATIENIRNSDPMVICEVMVYASDSGFAFGHMDAGRYGGELTFHV